MSLVAVALLASALLVASRGGVAHTGAWIDAAYTTAPPTIDGALAAGEWAGATAVDLGAIPGNGLPAFLLVENDGTYLYVAYDAIGDRAMDVVDQASVAFDTGHDAMMTPGGEDQFWWGSGAQNGQAHLTSDGSFWNIEDSPFDTGLPDHAGLASASGFGPSDLSAADHATYELQIPLVLIDAGPGEAIGLLGGSWPSPGVVDGATFTYDSWPDYLLGLPALDRFGDLRLGQPARVDDLDLNPPSQSRDGAPSSALLYTVTAVNRGTADDTFEITTLSTWTATLLDASGTLPLPDTNGDGNPDTGSVAPGGSADFMVQIDVPLGTGCDDALVAGASSNDPGVVDTAILHSCVVPAILSPPHSETGIDTDVPPNGKFNVLQVNVSTFEYVSGFYQVVVDLYDAGRTMLITSGPPQFVMLGAGPNVVPVALQGSDIYRSGIDGPYLAAIALYDDRFNLLDNGTHVTAAYLASDFDPPAAAFNPPHSDRGLDTDAPPNGLYDFLIVDAGVAVNRPGSFEIDAILMDMSGNFVAMGSASANLAGGSQVMPVSFLGRDIRSSGFDGPYIAIMGLYDASGDQLDFDFHMTGFYTSSQFEPNPAAFSPPHGDRGVDLTVPPDGAFEYLAIDASVQVVKAGRYSVAVELYDASGSRYITFAMGATDLDVGLQRLPVLLSGIDIVNARIDGPYEARMYLEDAFGPLGRDVHMTAPYAWTDFAPAGARLAPPYSDRLVDTDVPPDGLADFVAVDVGVDVMLPGLYTLTGALQDIVGRVLGSATGCGVLSAGPQTCTLLFDSRTIARLGAHGPFTAGFQLSDGYGRLLGTGYHVTAPYANGEFDPVDTTAPAATAAAVPYWINQMPLAVGFSASDPSPTDGLASIALLYRYSADNATWGAWTRYVTFGVSGSTASGSIPFVFPPGIGFYEFQCTATDAAGNAEATGPAEARAMYRPLASLLLAPSPLGVPAGQQRTLSVQVLGPDAQPAVLQAPLTVTLASSSPTGEFRAVGTSTRVSSVTIPAGRSVASVDYYDTSQGTWDLTASSGPTTDGVVQAVVSPGAAASVAIEPASAAVSVGGAFTFSAHAYDAFGNEVSTTFVWSADAAVGTISGAGVLTAATRVASGTVTVSVQGSPAVQAVADVVLLAGPAASVVLGPPSATVAAGGSQQFLAQALDAYGNAVAVSFAWSATAAIGTVSASGLLTAATTVASGTVTAAVVGAPSVSGSASVTLVPGPPAQVTIAPTTASVAVDGTAAFIAAVEDQYGNAVTGVPVTWTATGGIGSVDATGTFTAGHVAGSGQVRAVSGTAQATASVTVTAGPAARIAVTPSSAVLVVGSTQAFTAAVTDQYGNAVTGATITWTVTGAVGGVSSAGSLTAANSVGTGTVVATSGSLHGEAAVALVPGPAAAIHVSPASATVQYGTGVDLRAVVVDQYGNAIGNATVAWTASGPGTLAPATGATTTLSVTDAGTVTVTATSGSLTAQATFTVLGPSTMLVTGVGAGALIGGLAAGLAIGWILRARRASRKSEEEEKAEPPEEDEET